VAFRMRSFGVESSRELFKGSKDAASLLVSTRKKFWLGDADGLLGHLSPLHLALGPNR